MKLSMTDLRDRAGWEAAGVKLPGYDIAAARAEAAKNPTWVHFGAGNLFRAFPANLQQGLLEQGAVKGGVFVAETFDYEIVDAAYAPFDNLSLLVNLMPDGATEKTLIGSVAGALRADNAYPQDYARLKEIFRSPSLQMISFTITEKGYALTDMRGEFTKLAQADFAAGPGGCISAMGKVAALLLERYNAGATPLAVVSMDNCSHNGEKLRAGVVTMALQWHARGFVPQGYMDWLTDESKVSFPWSMIDKITPRPAPAVVEELTRAGIEGMEIIVTGKKTYTAGFVNSEKPQYLVIEDRFPNGRPPLEKVGVYMTDRDTVNNTERMKVTTCLNPLHTALAVYGCLLGYDSIAAEMRDPQLKALVEGVGYKEGLPVVVDPKILSPRDFINEVVEQRLPNPFIPDTPQRIATDTSQKMAIRFGETIKSYAARPDLDPASLNYVPLAIAGWLRYLLAVDDKGDVLACSSDPMLATLQEQLSTVKVGQPDSATDAALRPILSNATLFGVDLYQVGLAGKVQALFQEMLAGPGAVRATLQAHV